MWLLNIDNLKLLDIEKRSGIYKIIISKHYYIGSSKDIGKRLKTHLWSLIRHKHHNKTMQNCFNKYGDKNIYFDVVEYCNSNVLLQREKYYIDLINPTMNHIKDPIYIMRDDIYKQRLSNGMKNYYKTHKSTSRKIIYQYTISGKYITSYESVTDACKLLHNKITVTSLAKCARNINSTCAGYRWSYIYYKYLPQITKHYKIKPIYQYDINFNLIKIWYTYSSIYKELHVVTNTIKKILNKNIIFKNSYWSTSQNIDTTFYNNSYIYTNKSNLKPVYQYDLDGKFIRKWTSPYEAELYFSEKNTSKISAAARKKNKNKSAYGFQWSYIYKDHINKYINNSSKSRCIKVQVKDLQTNSTLTYNSIAELCNNLFPNNKFDSICAVISQYSLSNKIYKNKYIFTRIE